MAAQYAIAWARDTQFIGWSARSTFRCQLHSAEALDEKTLRALGRALAAFRLPG